MVINIRVSAILYPELNSLVKFTALYKQLMTKTTLTYISTNRTLNIVVYHYHLANNIYTHAQHTCAPVSPCSPTQIQLVTECYSQQQQQIESVFSTIHSLAPFLLPVSLMLSPHLLPIHMHSSTFNKLCTDTPHFFRQMTKFYWKAWASRKVMR